MSELLNQVQAHKARLQRFSEAAVRHAHKGCAKADIEQATILEGYLKPASVLPPIPNEAIAAASEIAFPRIVMNKIEAIQRAVLATWPGLTMSDMKSARRTAQVVRARQMAMYLSKEITSTSLPQIGKRFGGRDHTTVLHAVRRMKALTEKDPCFAAEMERIKASVQEVGIYD